MEGNYIVVKNNRKILDILIIIILCGCIMIPFFKDATLYTGVDMGFHLNREFEQYKILQSGHFFSQINTFSLNHLGAPVNMVYGFAYLYPLAFWMLIIPNYVIATYLGITTLLSIVGIISYWIGDKYWESSNKALAFAIMYTFSSYTFDIFFRSFSLAQASAMAFLPCVAYGIYSIFFKDKKDWVILSLGMTGTIYCHLISTLIYSSVILFIFIFALLLKQVNLDKVLAFIKAIIVTIIATLFFWINFLKVYLNNHSINTPASSDIFGSSVSDFSNALISSILGLVIVICFLIVLINWEKIDLKSKLTAILSFIYIFISIDISNVVWHFLNKTPIKHIQSVIRFRVLIVFFVLVCIVSASEFIFEKYSISLFLISSIVCCTWLSSCYMFINDQDRNKTVTDYYTIQKSAPFSNYKISNNTDFLNTVSRVYGGVGNLDYWTKPAMKNSNILMQKRILLNGKSTVVNVKPIVNGVVFSNLRSSAKDDIKLPFFIYNGLQYKVTNNNENVKVRRTNDGCLRIKLNYGSNRIKVQAIFQPIQFIFAGISIIFIILQLVLLLKNNN